VAIKIDMLFEDRLFVWLNWLIPAATMFFQGRWLTPDVYSVPLGRCDVGWHVYRGIVALACVGRDRIRVWPLPVKPLPAECAPLGVSDGLTYGQSGIMI
jgi:hypothetical protein